MYERFTLEDLASLIERLCPSSVMEMHAGHVHVDCGGVPFDARVVGSDTGQQVFSFASKLALVESFEDRFPLAKLLSGVTATACVRVVIDNGCVVFETRVVPGDIAAGQLDAVVRWRLAEFFAFTLAWRRRMGISREPPPIRAVTTLRDLVRGTPVAPQKALLVAAVGFAVAGADGTLSPRETARLHAWLKEVPSFAALDQARVLRAVAALAGDPARTLLEARRHLDDRERLLAWALANDMAHAEGYTSPEERRYLTSVASIFELAPEEMEPFIADAQERAVRRETKTPPPVMRSG